MECSLIRALDKRLDGMFQEVSDSVPEEAASGHLTGGAYRPAQGLGQRSTPWYEPRHEVEEQVAV